MSKTTDTLGVEVIDPSQLRPFYRDFLAGDRILLTGHSHQAWPQVAQEGLRKAYEDAGNLVDDKWVRAAQVADDVRREVAGRIGALPDQIALAQNTHELVTRFLSGLDLATRPKVVTTDGEFHSLTRQLGRLSELGLEVCSIAAEPVQTLSGRLANALDDKSAALMVSTVLFETSTVVPNLSEAVEAAHRHGAEVLLDAYHGFFAMPFLCRDFGPDPIFVTGGGYKYAQWGEGVCFLRVPPGEYRPAYTGWFADFAHLESQREAGPIPYGETGAEQFAGSTYDPVSHYRAREVIRFFAEHDLSTERLRELSLHQTQRIINGLGDLPLRTPRERSERGGFVAVQVENAAAVARELRTRRIFVDHRGSLLRLGPAPYVTNEEIDHAITELQRLLS